MNYVLNILEAANPSLKPRKCRFALMGNKYLGHIIRPGKLVVKKASTEGVEKMKLPTT